MTNPKYVPASDLTLDEIVAGLHDGTVRRWLKTENGHQWFQVVSHSERLRKIHGIAPDAGLLAAGEEIEEGDDDLDVFEFDPADEIEADADDFDDEADDDLEGDDD